MNGFRRQTPEEILASITKLKRGSFKIYIGAVSGAGKTYHMLREGHSLKQQGIDVVICAVSTLQRPETVAQVGDLERIPSIHWFKDGVEQKDLNLDALLQRNPEVVLVDGLAHRNRPDAPFSTRLADIQHLLSHGIGVITTMNVYELEGVREAAPQLIGLKSGSCVPSHTLELADEVRFIDATPEAILARLEEGHLQGTSADPALYKKGRLGVLRELALRLVAEGVNDSLTSHRRELGLQGPSGAAERILVATQYHWNGSIYVRRGQQIAKRLNGDLLVVTLRKRGKPLTKEEEAFHHSLRKLTHKIKASFAELPVPRRRAIAGILMDYAVQHQVTRIVMGHSRQTAWQIWWQGSVTNAILRKMRHIDLFVMSDRAAQGGERILPARVNSAAKAPEAFRRLSELELDASIRRIKRGKLKIYIGAAPGVGKTYAMLREGNELLRKGIDVKIGLLESHGRSETIAQIGELEVFPRLRTCYQGVQLEEMDTAGLIRQHPEVVLVDELAHTNIPGSLNKKRYEDVLDLLDVGISVITTVNVQHLESLSDAVLQITGVHVRETVPDRLLQLADEVQLIDMTPEALQQRMREGRIYAMNKIEQALTRFFKIGNLIALRELALREIADDVDERLESMERPGSLRGPWRRQEMIYVCATEALQAERLIRRGFRLAYRLKAAWQVNFLALKGDDVRQQDLEGIKKMTMRLGGAFSFQTVERKSHIAPLFAARATAAGATQIIVGNHPAVKRLLTLTRHMDVLIVADA
ncbi:histidine kinase [Paenibacillus ferrarius]|uniref:histidine kinase n=1 Tax=Paenibacillus ferrarius TaxID=1469647 RepID=UPI003D29DE5C